MGYEAYVIRNGHYKQLLLANTLAVGSFLFQRISGEQGRDSRFEGIREVAPKFFGAFMAQATWVSLCLLPVLAVNSISPGVIGGRLPFFLLTDLIGFGLYAGGLTFEATADKQKSDWMADKKAKKHDEGFCTRGLWSYSRHPNYFGKWLSSSRCPPVLIIVRRDHLVEWHCYRSGRRHDEHSWLGRDGTGGWHWRTHRRIGHGCCESGVRDDVVDEGKRNTNE